MLKQLLCPGCKKYTIKLSEEDKVLICKGCELDLFRVENVIIAVNEQNDFYRYRIKLKNYRTEREE